MMRKADKLLWILVACLAALSPGLARSALATKEPMPDFFEGQEWIGSEPLKRSDLAGEVILIGFWDFACAPCQTSAAFLNRMHDKYSLSGLTVIGVQTPDYPFEADAPQVRAAVARMKLKFPVVIDKEGLLWRAYNNHERPTHYFVDTRGRIRRQFPGDLYHPEQERLIQELLEEGHYLFDVDLDPEAETPAWRRRETKTVFLGTRRISYYGGNERILAGQMQRFHAPEQLRTGFFYVNGIWQFEEEQARHPEGPGVLLLRFSGTRVGMIAGFRQNVSEIVEIRMNGLPVPLDFYGKDLVLSDERDISTVSLGTPRFYDLINTRGEYQEESVLEIRFEEGGAEVYGLVFS